DVETNRYANLAIISLTWINSFKAYSMAHLNAVSLLGQCNLELRDLLVLARHQHFHRSRQRFDFLLQILMHITVSPQSIQILSR
ncbi:hypothetical protein PFISCL1PPCAC_20293, partial [Pristionchus fissidentatus]